LRAAVARLSIGPGQPSGQRGRRAGWRRLLASAVLALAVAGGACFPVNRNEDMRIEAEIKARLVDEKFANLTRLGVLSRGGVVYLSGTVASADERARAETLSRSVQGVGRVVNRLEVLPE
jgi:hypothetical protein